MLTPRRSTAGLAAVAALVLGLLAPPQGPNIAVADVVTPAFASELQAGGTDTLTPVLSGLVQDQNQELVIGKIFLLDAAGRAIGDSPTAFGAVPSGERVTYRVPA